MCMKCFFTQMDETSKRDRKMSRLSARAAALTIAINALDEMGGDATHRWAVEQLSDVLDNVNDKLDEMESAAPALALCADCKKIDEDDDA